MRRRQKEGKPTIQSLMAQGEPSGAAQPASARLMCTADMAAVVENLMKAVAELTSQAHERTAAAVAAKLPASLKEPGAMPILKELFETLDLTYTCCPTWRQDQDTGPLLLATRRAANDCIVHWIGLLADPADGQAYRETVKMMFERLGRKGLPTRTKDDHEKVAGILNAR